MEAHFSRWCQQRRIWRAHRESAGCRARNVCFACPASLRPDTACTLSSGGAFWSPHRTFREALRRRMQLLGLATLEILACQCFLILLKSAESGSKGTDSLQLYPQIIKRKHPESCKRVVFLPEVNLAREIWRALGRLPLSSCVVLRDRLALASLFWHMAASILVRIVTIREQENLP